MAAFVSTGFTYGDQRIDRRAKEFYNNILEALSVVIRKMSGYRNREVAFHRLLENEKFSLKNIVEDAAHQTQSFIHESDHVLCIQDTTELKFNVETDQYIRPGLGPLTKSFCKGFFLHPGLLVDGNNSTILGLSDIISWVRKEPEFPKLKDKNGKSIKNKDYNKLPIEDKESNRWVQLPTNTKKRFKNLKLLTYVFDREGDIYEEWDRVPEENIHLIIRSSSDRKLKCGSKLFEKLDSIPVSMNYVIDLCAITGKRSARKAEIELSYTTVEILKPKNCNDKNAKKSVVINAIIARETTKNVPENKRILWRLLTTHEVNSNEDALRIINWYKLRWLIEQLFRTLKSQGLNIESSQIEDGELLQKLALAALVSSTKAMQLVQARDGKNDRTIADVFKEEDAPILEKLSQSLEGRTQKQKNPYPPGSLAWGSWIIGRLGGWKGYSSERPPGPITMRNGLEAYSRIKVGYMLKL